MSTYNFEDFEPSNDNRVEKLEQISFAINQLFNAISEDATRILSRRNEEDPDTILALETQLLRFCIGVLIEQRIKMLNELGIEDEDDILDDEDELLDDRLGDPISLEEIAEFRRLLGNEEAN